MNRVIKFKGKSTLKGSEGKWVIGHYFIDHEGKSNIYNNKGIDGWFSHPIDPKTLCQFTGKTTCKGNEVFENCIVFEEIMEEDRDIRLYYICKWIEEWSRFVLLTLGELMNYEDNGIKELEDDGTFGMQDIEKLHYAGNYIDNPELMEMGDI